LDSNNIIYSFELNGNVVYGSKFVPPSESGTIEISNVQVLKVQNNCTDLVSLNLPESLTIGVSKILLNSNVSGKGVSSFKLNGKTVEGDNFIVTKDLGNSIIITDVILTEGKTIESSHYPVSESDCGAIQEIRFSGATAVKVTVTYQTGNNAMVILTDQNAENPAGEGVFNSNDLTTETYVIDGEGVMFMYYASSMDDLNYYGYKVTVVDGTLAEIIDENAEASLTAIKSGDMLTAVLFKDFKSANEYYKKAMDEDKEKEDQVVKKNGKWVFVGTEDAIEDFTKLF
jgi:hypothetical protein